MMEDGGMQVDSQMLAIGISSSSTRTKRPEFPRVPLNAYAPGDVNSFPFTCAFDSNSTTIAPHPSGYRLSIALDREGRAADDVHHSSRWRSGEKMSGVVEIVAPSPSSSIAARRMHSCSLRAFWQSTSIYQIARKEVDRNNTNQLTKFQGYHQFKEPRIVIEDTAEWSRGDILAGEGIELWRSNADELLDGFPLLAVSSPQDLAPPINILNRSTAAATSTVLPFSFTLPVTTRTTKSNRITKHATMPAGREALHRFDRSPPPSLSNSCCTDGCVEWVIEALVTFETDERTTTAPPTFDDRRAPQLGEGGLLRPTADMLIQRILFPFEPLDRDVQDLYSSWSPLDSKDASRGSASGGAGRNDNGRRFGGHSLSGSSSITVLEGEDLEPERQVDAIIRRRKREYGSVPSFSKDLRDEALGGVIIYGNEEVESAFVQEDGADSKWCSFEKLFVLRNFLGRTTSTIRSEVSIPFPLTTTRYSTSLPLIFHFSRQAVDSLASKKTKPIAIEKIVAVLHLRTSTRGGSSTKPVLLLEELRRQEMKLWNDAAIESSTTLQRNYSGKNGEIEDGRRHLLLNVNANVDLRMDLELQSEGVSPSGTPLIPLSRAGLSFYTPNIEREYAVTISVHLVGGESFCVLRVPLQVLAGDQDPLPSFEFGGSSGVVPEADEACGADESHDVDELPRY